MASSQPPAPSERSLTVRAALKACLLRGPTTAKELSAEVRISEKEVALHLEHLARSALAQGQTLVVSPAQCLGCGHAFRQRQRYTKPSRCPRCKSERIDPPAFQLQAPPR